MSKTRRPLTKTKEQIFAVVQLYDSILSYNQKEAMEELDNRIERIKAVFFPGLFEDDILEKTRVDKNEQDGWFYSLSDNPLT